MKRPLLTLLLLVLLGSTPCFADQKKDTVIFNPLATGPSEQIVQAIWKRDPKYAEYVKIYSTAPEHMTGTYDLNDDGVKEIFARHSDPESPYCDPTGYTCLLMIYEQSNNQIKEIGRFMAGPDVVILPEKTGAYHRILSQDVSGHLKSYSWNGSSYAPN